MYNLIGLGVACLVLRARPSTVIRLGEDVFVRTGSRIAKKVSAISHDFNVEFQARKIDALQHSIQVKARTLRGMTETQLRELARNESEVFHRVAQLQRERQSKQSRREDRRASRVGRNATV